MHTRTQGAGEPSLEGLDLGNHGYDNDVDQMRPLFMAAGPDFKKGYSFSEPFANVDVFPLLCRILRLAAPPSNGSYQDVSHLMRHEIPEVSNSAHASYLLPSIMLSGLVVVVGEFRSYNIHSLSRLPPIS